MKSLYTLLILLIPFLGISQTIYVTNTNNEGPGSFRDAVENAPNGTTVTFDNSLLGQTIYLYGTDVQIYSEITIKGIIEDNEYITINLDDDIWYYDAVIIEDIRMKKSISGLATLNNFIYNNDNVTIINSIFENFDNSLFSIGGYQEPFGSRVSIDNCTFNNCSGIFTISNGTSNYDSIIVTNSNFNSTYSSFSSENSNIVIDNCNLDESSLNIYGLNAIIANTDLGSGLNVNVDNNIKIFNCYVFGDITLNSSNNSSSAGITISDLNSVNSVLSIFSNNSLLITNSEFNAESGSLFNGIYANEIGFYGNTFSNFGLLSFDKPFESQSDTYLSTDSCYFYDSKISISNFDDVVALNSMYEDLNNENSSFSCTYFTNLSFFNSTFNIPSTIENYQSFTIYPNTPSTFYIENSTLNSPNIFQFSGSQNSDLTLLNSTLNGKIKFITIEGEFNLNSYNSIVNEISDIYYGLVGTEEYLSNINYNSYGYNLIGELSAEIDGLSNTDIINVDNINLKPLDFYGGHTKTMPPNECSPALDAGDSESIDISQNQLSPVGVKDIGAAESDVEIVRYNCDNGNCFSVNDASGQYCTLNDCELNCVSVETFSCINDACIDPMDGTGLFSTLNDCEQACQNVSSISETLIDINIYPNPSSNIFNLVFYSETESEILVTNVLGEQVYIESTKSIGEFTTQIDLSNYSKGIYNLTIKTSDGISNHKLILR